MPDKISDEVLGIVDCFEYDGHMREMFLTVLKAEGCGVTNISNIPGFGGLGGLLFLITRGTSKRLTLKAFDSLENFYLERRKS